MPVIETSTFVITKCADCGETLNSTYYPNYGTLTISACPKCLVDAAAEAVEQMQEAP